MNLEDLLTKKKLLFLISPSSSSSVLPLASWLDPVFEADQKVSKENQRHGNANGSSKDIHQSPPRRPFLEFSAWEVMEVSQSPLSVGEKED